MKDPAGPAGRTAVVVAAHGDDETLGCGGTLARLAADGWDVRVVVVSDGTVPRPDGVADNRSATARACAVLGVEAPVFLGFADQRLDTVPLVDVTAALVGLGLEPDLLVTHAATDLNHDHRRVAESVLVAWRPGPRTPSVLAMEVPGSTAWSGTPFDARLYVDVTDTFETKVEALQEYHHELRPAPHPRSVAGIRATAAYHGLQAGCALAEAFGVVRAVAGRLP